MEEGVECRGRLTLGTVTVTGCQGVDEGSRGEEGDRGERSEHQVAAVVGHERQHDANLEDGHCPLLDAIDQDALHIGHILHQTGHDVAGGAVVEPRQGEHLDAGVEIASKIKDHPLLEVIVKQDAQAVKQILGEEGGKAREDQG